MAHFTRVVWFANRAGKIQRVVRGINSQDEYHVDNVQQRIVTTKQQQIRAGVRLEELEKELFKYERNTG